MIYFGYFSFSAIHFGVENTKSFIRSRGSLENHTQFKTIIVKIYTHFQTKTTQKPYLWGGTHLFSLYRGVLLQCICIFNSGMRLRNERVIAISGGKRWEMLHVTLIMSGLGTCCYSSEQYNWFYMTYFPLVTHSAVNFRS